MNWIRIQGPYQNAMGFQVGIRIVVRHIKPQISWKMKYSRADVSGVLLCPQVKVRIVGYSAWKVNRVINMYIVELRPDWCTYCKSYLVRVQFNSDLSVVRSRRCEAYSESSTQSSEHLLFLSAKCCLLHVTLINLGLFLYSYSVTE